MYQLSSLRNQIKALTWDLIEKYYNVDRDEPNILTAKHMCQFNQIDYLGEDLSLLVEGLINAAVEYERQTNAKKNDYPGWD